MLLDLLGGSPVHTDSKSSAVGLTPVAPAANNMDLLDLLGGIGDPSPVMSSNDTMMISSSSTAMNVLDGFGTTTTPVASVPVTNNGGLLDGSLFSGLGNNSATMGNNNSNNNNNTLMGGLLDDLTSSAFSGGPLGAVEPQGEVISRSGPMIKYKEINRDLFRIQIQEMPSMTALDKAGLTVVMSPRKANGCLTIVMTASNNSLNTLDQFLFQVKRSR